MRSVARFALVALLGGCGAEEVTAVGVPPGGVFRPGAGCSVADLQGGGAQVCRSPAQLSFDELGADALLENLTPALLHDKQVSCRRSFCGPGSLAMRAEYTRPTYMSPEDGHHGEVRYLLPAPVEFYGKTVTYALYVDGPTTPVNAQIGLMDTSGLYRLVQDGPIAVLGQWEHRGGMVLVDNPVLKLPDDARSLLAREIRVKVYLATEVRSGDRAHWSGEVFVDDIAWR